MALAAGDPLEGGDAALRDERGLRGGRAGRRRRPHLEHAVHVAARHHGAGGGEAAVRDLGVVLQVLLLAQEEVVQPLASCLGGGFCQVCGLFVFMVSLAMVNALVVYG